MRLSRSAHGPVTQTCCTLPSIEMFDVIDAAKALHSVQ